MRRRRPEPRSTWWLNAALVALLLVPLAGCAEDGDDAAAELAAAESALYAYVSSDIIAFDWAHSAQLPHGIDGDRDVVFVVEPLAGRVAVRDRIRGHVIAELPPPPGGFKLAFAVQVTGPGHVVVLDSGGFPSPTELAVPAIYEYDYRLKKGRRHFQATLERAVTFTGVPVGYAEDMAVADDGTVIVSDSVLGSLWVVDPDDTIRPGIIPPSFAPQDAIPELGGCGFPAGVEVDGIPFTPPGGFAPGVGELAVGGGYLYFGGSCLGGLYRLPLASLSDARAPWERAADIEVVSPRPPGKTQETLKAFGFNRFDPSDPWLYVADPFTLSLIRIHPETGERELLATDDYLFNFTVAGAFLPPLGQHGPTPLVMASDQEHRFAALNVNLTTDLFETPFVLTRVFVH